MVTTVLFLQVSDRFAFSSDLQYSSISVLKWEIILSRGEGWD